MPILRNSCLRLAALLCLPAVPAFAGAPASKAPAASIIRLRADALTEPLGIDDPAPSLSWEIADKAHGARQIAYRLTVYSKSPESRSAEPDVWDSGRIDASTSTGVRYAGARLEPSHRYFWRVQVWGQAGRPYPVSKSSWWETGLLEGAAWQGQWIGHEADELHRLRASGAQWITNPSAANPPGTASRHAFRLRFQVEKPIRTAVLYTTGQDTAASWVNGYKVMSAKPLNAWQQMPWGTYERQEVTAHVHAGSNLLAIEVTHYPAAREAGPPGITPMSACLYMVMADGTNQLFISEALHWKAALNASGEWWQPAFDDAAWPSAEAFPAPAAGLGGTETGRPWPTGPVALLRRTFQTDDRIVSARLYATALGAYKFHINGKPVGDQILAPGWMDFREHVAYQVYDVTAEIKPGANALGAYLAPGWYTTPLKWLRQGNNYGDTAPALRAQLRLEHADGHVTWIATDERWKAAASEIVQAEIYDGETLDARKRFRGWDLPTFSDAAWSPAEVERPLEPKMVAQYFPPIREDRVLTVKQITTPTPGVYVLDFGQNMTAVPRLRVQGQAGDDIQLRFAEVLNPDGTVYVENLRNAKATDHFILPGTRVETFQPEFTFHGFRYMEVTGLRHPPTSETLKAVVLHTDAAFTTRFQTGNAMVNKLWSNVLWGQRSNFVGVPTDCPQRDERLGWSADAQVFWRTAAYNMDLETFSRKYAADLAGTQAGTAMYGIFAPGVEKSAPGFGAAWSDAGVIVPWTSWMQTGDRTIIDENWPAMQRYLAAIEAENPDHLWRRGFGIPFGDWLTPTVTTPEDLVATAYWAYDAAMLRDMAQATGRSADAGRYGTMYEAIKTAFEKAYVREDGTVGSIDHYPSIPPPTIHPGPHDGKKDHFVETQTGYVLALHMGLVPDSLKAKAATRLIGLLRSNRWLLGTGFLGTPYLLEVLSDAGYSSVAYKLLSNEEYPSWGYLIDHGATTTWERWNGNQMRGDPSMNSYNHYAYGAVAEWIYRDAAGIDTVASDAGFHTILLHPHFDARLKRMSLDYDSPFGTIHSDWTVRNETVTWHVNVPPNTHADFRPELTNAKAFLLNGAALDQQGATRLDPGEYTLSARVSEPDVP